MPMRPELLCGCREGICRRGKHATRSSNARLCVMDRGLGRQERSHHGLLLQQARHHVAVRFHPDELDRANDDAGCDGQLLSHMRHDWPAGRPTRHRVKRRCSTIGTGRTYPGTRRRGHGPSRRCGRGGSTRSRPRASQSPCTRSLPPRCCRCRRPDTAGRQAAARSWRGSPAIRSPPPPRAPPRRRRSGCLRKGSGGASRATR
mmetsp:Transcript_22725/g.74187  ORF Transcript_22725/g.74187 Transcript_22725/m.74187 type:complete len:203 (+) Transcript_22725:142-750(+)